MKIWLDTEFIEDGKTIDLVSIGMVREDGATYYAETNDYIPGKADEWVKENVLAHLHRGDAIKPRDVIAREIIEFAGENPEFWAYYADYDWVVLCQLFGRMVDLPEGWPMFCRDIKQWCVDLGNPKLPTQSSTEHHALEDARWNREAWLCLADRASRAPVDGAEPVAWGRFSRTTGILSATTDKAVADQWATDADQSEFPTLPLYAAPPAPAADAQDVGELVEAAGDVLQVNDGIPMMGIEVANRIERLRSALAAYKRSTTDGQS